MSVIAIPELDLMTLDVTSEEFRQGAVFAAEEYQDAVARLTEAMETIQHQTKRLAESFDSDSSRSYTFGIRFDYGYQRSYRDTKEIIESIKRDAWKCLVAKLRIREVMSLKKREEFNKQLESGELPDITPETICSVIMGLAGSAQQYADDAAKEVFEFLRPWRKDYKTNSVFKIGRRVILSGYIGSSYSSAKPFRVSYHGDREQRVTMIDNIMHRLDGKATIRNNQCPLSEAINNCGSDGRAETEYFKIRCCKNGNLHIEFKRLDLVKQINLLGMGEFVLGEADTEV